MFDVDPYDNREFLSKLASEVRERLLKIGEDLSSTRDSLADGQFALIMITPEDPPRKLRKFACTDTGNTIQSVCCLLEAQHRLPEEAVKIASQNLLRASQDFGISIPEELSKLAGDERPETNLVILDYRDQKVAKELTTNGRHQEKKKDFVFSKEGSDSIGEIGHGQNALSRVSTFGSPEERAKVRDKVCSKFPGLRERHEERMKSAAEVRDAVQLFRDNRDWMDGWEKRALSQVIVDEGQDFAREIPPEIWKYASQTYDSDLGTAIICRQLMAPSLHPLEKAAEIRDLYRELYQEKDSLRPEEFAVRLGTLDDQFGLSKIAAVPDSVYSTFGQKKPDLDATEKQIFTYAGEGITATDLRRFVDNFSEWLKEKLGEKTMLALQKNPEDVFLSLPLPQKRAIVMAAFREGGHARADGELRNL